jgi:hypothetical protein
MRSGINVWSRFKLETSWLGYHVRCPPSANPIIKSRWYRIGEGIFYQVPTHLAPTHEACRDRPSLCTETRGHQRCSRPARVNDISVHIHLHKGSLYFSVFGVFIRSQYSQWLKFRLRGGGGVRNMLYFKYMCPRPPPARGLSRPIEEIT